jgi:hypothetical protein
LRPDIERDLADSISDMRRVVIPVVSVLLGATKWTQAETVEPTSLSDALDLDSGIDWIVRTGTTSTTIASRVQWDQRSWDTFTIRETRSSGAVTEMSKRKESINAGDALYPVLTLQAYVQKPRARGKLLAVAVCRTADLYAYLDDHELRPVYDRARYVNYWRRVNEDDGNTFWCVPWAHLAEHSWLERYPPEEVECWCPGDDGYPPPWIPCYDYGHWNRRWGTILPDLPGHTQTRLQP